MADDSGIDFGDVLQAFVAVAVAVGLDKLLNPEQKQKNQVSEYPLLQSDPPVYYLFGDYVRVGGAFAFYEAEGGWFGTIQAVNDGYTEFGGYYLGDDVVTLDGSGYVVTVNGGDDDGRYIDQRVMIKTRNGLATETAYSEIIARWPDLWTADDRGDGTGSVMMLCSLPKQKFRAQAFPAGHPTLTVLARGRCYDWRDETQDRADDTTWKACANPVIWRVHLEWTRWGCDWDSQIAPVLADLTIEADVCDEPVALSAGGTEPRYRLAGKATADINPDVVRKKIDAAMDGFSTFDVRGRLVVKAGRYVAPTFTLTDPDILGWQWSSGRGADSDIDQIVISFTDPNNLYNTGQCDPWVIKAGDKTDPLDLEYVQSWTQARRLGKIAAGKRLATSYGTLNSTVYGLNGLTERYIAIQNSDEPSLADAVAEVVTGTEFFGIDGVFVYNLQSADPTVYAWNPASEEGTPVTAATRSAREILVAPDIDAVTAIKDSGNSRLTITATGPDREDISWLYRTRITGGTVWDEKSQDDVIDLGGGQVQFTTDFVSTATSLDVQVAYITGTGTLSDWGPATPFVVNTAYVDPPTDLAVNISGTTATVSWKYPATTFGNVILYRATTANFSDAVAVHTESGTVSAPDSDVETGLAAAKYWWWIIAYSDLGQPSVTVGPVTGVVEPAWVTPGVKFQIEAKSTSNRCWINYVEYASIAAAIAAGVITFSRASAKWAVTNTGTYSSFSSGAQALTNYGFSLEPAETNSILYSDTFSNAAWVANAASKIAGQTTPFGSDGVLVTCNGASGQHYLRQDNLTTVVGQTYRAQYWVKAGTCDRVQLTFGGAFSGTAYANFYLNGSGSISAQGAAATAATIRLENGWYIIMIEAVASSSSSAAQAHVAALFSGVGATGTETRLPTLTLSTTWYVGHAEFKQGNVSGTPKTTTSAAFTRAADALVIKLTPGTYTIVTKLGGATVTTQNNLNVTSAGWSFPVAANRYVDAIAA